LKKLFAGLMRYHPIQKILTLVILGLAIQLTLPQIATLEESGKVIASLARWAVALSVIAQVMSYLGNGFLLQKTLALARQIVSLARSTLIIMGATSIGMVAGGIVGSTAAIYHWTRADRRGSMEGATLASILPPLFNNLMLILLSIFGLIYLMVAHNLTQAQEIGFSAALAILGLLAGIYLLVVRFRKQATTVTLRVSRWWAQLRRREFNPASTIKGLDRIFTAWDALIHGQWQLLMLGAFINAIFDIMTLYFLFVAAGNVISFGILFAGYGLPLLLGRVAFIIPGGVGVVETSMAALYTGLGIPSAIAVVVVLGYRLISFWIPSLTGFLVAAYLQNTSNRQQP